MNTFVRTNKAMNYLQKISRMTLLTLSIIFSISATSAPIYSNSSDRSSDASSSASSSASSYSMQPALYQMTNTSNYQVSTTLNPAQTVYAPFSDENPSNGPSRISGRKNGDDIEWNEGEWGENADPGKQENSFPLGDAWSLLIFAALGAGVIYIKQRKAEAKG
jgi:hypothetical protein